MIDLCLYLDYVAFMETVVYLAKLISSLILGVFVGKKTSKKILKFSDFFLSITLYLLLFFMGVNTGSIEGILSKLDTIGAKALLVTVFSIGGTVIVSTIASYLIDFKKHKIVDEKGYIKNNNIIITNSDVNSLYNQELKEEAKIQLKRHRFKKAINVIKEPLVLISIVFLGIILRLFTPLFNWFESSIISYLLYFLLFFSGVGIIKANIKIKEIFSSPVLLLLPVWTVVGTYLGAASLSLISDFTLKESLGLSSGFGWYSLSGIMITDLGYPILGSISFLSNIFRESFSFFLIPIFSKFGRRFYYPAVCVGGATTMDVTLPIITTHFGPATIIPSMYHGLCMTILVPFLIPLFF